MFLTFSSLVSVVKGGCVISGPPCTLDILNMVVKVKVYHHSYKNTRVGSQDMLDLLVVSIVSVKTVWQSRRTDLPRSGVNSEDVILMTS